MEIYFGKKLQGQTMESIELQIIEKLKPEGFGVVTEISMTKTFKDKLNIEFRPYKILGVCNPRLAHSALSKDDKIGVMLPCNICIQQLSDSTIEIFAINPMAVMQGFDVPGLDVFAEEVTRQLTKVLDQLQ